MALSTLIVGWAGELLHFEIKLCAVTHTSNATIHTLTAPFWVTTFQTLTNCVETSNGSFSKLFCPTVFYMIISENVCIPLIQPSAASGLLFWEVHMGPCYGAVSPSSMDHSSVLPWMMLLQASGMRLLNKRQFHSPNAFQLTAEGVSPGFLFWATVHTPWWWFALIQERKIQRNYRLIELWNPILGPQAQRLPGCTNLPTATSSNWFLLGRMNGNSRKPLLSFPHNEPGSCLCMVDLHKPNVNWMYHMNTIRT